MMAELGTIAIACLLPVGQAPAEEPLTDKTMVVWAAPADLDQRGGSVLTLDGLLGRFDGVVFGELERARWMAGSNTWLRTERAQAAWPEETASAETFVQIAVVWEGDQVRLYRNGAPYAQYTMPNPPQSFPASSVALIGRRHLDVGNPNDSFAGRIRDARIYRGALTQESIAGLVPDDASGSEPWAWWSFAEGSATERTGRFPETRLLGDVRLEGGCLVLGGDGATLLGYPAGGARAATAWSAGESVPREAIESARALREQMLADPWRPAYHFVMPEDNGMPGDPNGAFYANGRYHLMYLFHDGQAFVWGHASSADLVHWRLHPLSLGPGEGDTGIFSGGGFVDDDGSAWMTYWGLGDPPRGICLARSTDEQFERWTKSPANPVVRSTAMGYTVERDAEGKEIVYGSADPSNIWKHDGHYYMLAGSLLVLNRYGKELGQAEHLGDTAYLFRSDDLAKWDYVGPFYRSRREWTHEGEDDMCPVFLPLPSSPEGGPPSDKHLLLFISHCDGCQYYIGSYGGESFTPESHGRMTWVDNAYFAPEALADDRGRIVMWSWLLDNPPQDVIDAQGWQGVYGLPRLLWLREDGALGMRPVDELASLRETERDFGPQEVAADAPSTLEGLADELLELEVTFEPGEAPRVGVSVCRSADGQEETRISYDRAEGKLLLDTTRSSLGFGRKVVETAPLTLAEGEPLTLRVFVDRSVVEVYANERQAICRRVYPTLGGRGVALLAEGGTARAEGVRAWRLSPSNAW